MSTTNVQPTDLNYHRYTANEYDHGIIAAIPGHEQLHERLVTLLAQRFSPTKALDVLDLGTGTAITADIVRRKFPRSRLRVMDFSETMIEHARARLGDESVTYSLGDYSEGELGGPYDVVTSIIGMHHQTDEGKQKLFAKIHKSLRRNGVFALGDLMTFKDEQETATAAARHFHHLVEQAGDDKKMLAEWAYHHLYLNKLTTMEAQQEWLQAAGFKTSDEFRKFQTVLLLAQKGEATRRRIRRVMK